MNIDNVLKFIGLVSLLEEPEKYQKLIDLVSKENEKRVEHGYYYLKTGCKYNGEVHIHGCGSPFTDGNGNIIVWR